MRYIRWEIKESEIIEKRFDGARGMRYLDRYYLLFLFKVATVVTWP